jgi:hypothetical protein
VAFFLAAKRVSRSTIGMFAAMLSGENRSKPDRRSVFGSSFVVAVILPVR